MTVTISVDGLKELEMGIAQIAKTATRKALGVRVLKKGAQPFIETASRLAPDDPATPPLDLHTSIAVSTKQKSGQQRQYTRSEADEVTVYAGPTADGYPQAVVQEFGTIHQPGKPYMRPAWDTEQMKVLELIVAGLKADLEKTLRRQERRNARRA